MNCDALQLYRGLPIATNKVSVAERESVPHHLLDCIGLEEEPWTVTQFRKHAISAIEEIKSRGRLPILVGGTHYYTQSVLFKDTLLDDTGPPISTEEIEQRWPILRASSEEMLEELKRVDPAMAKSWHPKDKRKIRRSLEIWLTTGQKPSEAYEKQKPSEAYEKQKPRTKAHIDDATPAGGLQEVGSEESQEGSQHMMAGSASSLHSDPLVLWTHASPSVLRSRLDGRTESMLDQGLLAEVESMYRSLQEQESAGRVIDPSRGIWVAIGYKEFIPYLLALQKGEVSRKELDKLKHAAVEATRIRTRQYAKYQIRWIRTKLFSALSNAGYEQRLFLLDGSDASSWAKDVSDTGKNIVAAFLEGNDLPDPLSLCPAAMDMLCLAGKHERTLRHCDICNKSTMTDDSWQDHLKSTRHRNTIRAKAQEKTSVISAT